MRIVLRVIGLLRSHLLLLGLAYICLLGSVASSMAVPWLIKEAIDIGIAQSDLSFLIFAGLAILALSMLRGGASYGQSYIMTYISQRVAYELRNALYDAFQRLSFSYHDRERTGQLMSRLTRLMNNLPSPPVPPTTLTAVVSAGALTFSWPPDYLGCRLESNSVSVATAGSWFTVSSWRD